MARGSSIADHADFRTSVRRSSAAVRRRAGPATYSSAMQYGARRGIWNILELLDKYRVKATFFVLGTTAEKCPDTVQAAAVAGHEIAGIAKSIRCAESARLLTTRASWSSSHAMRDIVKPRPLLSTGAALHTDSTKQKHANPHPPNGSTGHSAQRAWKETFAFGCALRKL